MLPVFIHDIMELCHEVRRKCENRQVNVYKNLKAITSSNQKYCQIFVPLS